MFSRYVTLRDVASSWCLRSETFSEHPKPAMGAELEYEALYGTAADFKAPELRGWPNVHHWERLPVREMRSLFSSMKCQPECHS